MVSTVQPTLQNVRIELSSGATEKDEGAPAIPRERGPTVVQRKPHAATQGQDAAIFSFHPDGLFV
jgi:hypothetical protein